MAGGKRQKAPCRVAVLGERKHFFMLPRCVVDSAAYRDLSLHARAVLIEIGVRSDGFNNGRIGVSQRALVDAVRCSPNRIVKAVAELMMHGLIDVTAEGSLANRRAREYRLTFVSTPNAPATNDYIRWTPTTKKTGGTGVVAKGGHVATGAIAEPNAPATGAIARLHQHRRKTVNSADAPATGAVSHISKPCPAAPEGEREGDKAHIPNTPYTAGHRCEFITEGDQRCCEQCGGPFDLGRADRAFPRRFCSETCRKRAERARAAERRKHESEPEPVGGLASSIVRRIQSGATRA